MKIEIDDKTASKLVRLAKAGADFKLSGSEELLATLSEAVKATRMERRTQNSAKCEAYRAAAAAQYGSDGEVEIDSNAIVSLGADPGAYVQAWVWVYDE